MAKVRKGFVSNSSSSSFIVAFPRGFVPTTTSVGVALFGGLEGSQRFYDYHADHKTIAGVVAEDMQSQMPNNKETIASEMDSDIDMDNYLLEGHDYKINWPAYEKDAEVAVAKKTDELMTKWADKDIYVFEYSDGDGSLGCCMEHGGTFDAVEHIRVSKH